MLFIFLIAFAFSSLVAKQEYEHIKCAIRPCERPSGKRPNPRILSGPSINAISTSSTNWCGYVAAPNLNKPVPFSVSKVSGSWIVPSLQASSVDTWCSIWVGIDGAGSPSVEQLGTEHDVQGGVVSHYAWFEMFPAGSNEIVGFPVNIGDHISASVTYVPLSNIIPNAMDLFILQISNDTQRKFSVIPMVTNAHMERVCAEWVVEAPYMNEILPLSNFGTVFLSNCTSVIHNVSGAVNSPAWSYESMVMIAPDGTIKAVPSTLSPDGKSFSVSWKSN